MIGENSDSEEFKQACVDTYVEATVQAFLNPGNLQAAMRMITFRNFNIRTVKVIQGKKTHMIPGNGTVQVLLSPDEPMPRLERMED